MSAPLGAGLRLLPFLPKNGSASHRRFFPLLFPLSPLATHRYGLVLWVRMHLFIGKEVVLSQHDRDIRGLLAPEVTDLFEIDEMEHHWHLIDDH